MKKYICVFCLFFGPALVAQVWQGSYAEALSGAQARDKLILLVFAGSDWCAPCIKLDKEVWQSDAFCALADENYMLYKADFPKKKANRLPDVVAAQNAALAQRYNPNGYFPLVLLLDKEGVVLGETGYLNGSPKAYIEYLNSFVK